MGFLGKVKEEMEKAQQASNVAKEKAKQASNKTKATADAITVSTAPIHGAYKIIDVIFALDSHKEGLFTSAKPEKAFDKVINQLRSQCLDLGGDAVTNCQFEYRVAVSTGIIMGAKQVMEIFAYGTVVKKT
jgi:hypothetical protein